MARKNKKHRKVADDPAMAESADLHDLYERSVQNAEQEVEFLDEAFFELRRRRPARLREDFCGTANAACRWVAVNRHHRAIGVDIDPEVLEWGRQRHLETLPESSRERVTLINADVRTVTTEPVDILVAFNFSYWFFKERRVMLDYFRSVRSALVEDGMFFLDVFGGSDAYTECKEKTKHKGFTYVWEQASFDPITADYVCYIHFRFRDGSRIKRAFRYEWRLWTLPELRDLLAEAGFSRSHVYWEGEDDDGEPSGEYHQAVRGENDLAWVCYLVAER